MNFRLKFIAPENREKGTPYLLLYIDTNNTGIVKTVTAQLEVMDNTNEAPAHWQRVEFEA